MYCLCFSAQWRSKGGGSSWGTFSGAKSLGAHQHFIQPFKNAKFRPNYA